MVWIILGVCCWLLTGLVVFFWIKRCAREVAKALKERCYFKLPWYQRIWFFLDWDWGDAIWDIKEISVFWGRSKFHEILGLIVITVFGPLRLGLPLVGWGLILLFQKIGKRIHKRMVEWFGPGAN